MVLSGILFFGSMLMPLTIVPIRCVEGGRGAAPP